MIKYWPYDTSFHFQCTSHSRGPTKQNYLESCVKEPRRNLEQLLHLYSGSSILLPWRPAKTCILEQELELWKKNRSHQYVTSSVIQDTLIRCQKKIFPNINIILTILYIQPLIPTECERYFRAQRLKHYNIFIISTNRLND